MLHYFKELAVIPNIPCEKLAVVVTHDRKEFVSKWLRAWNNAEHYGTKIAVIHAFDGKRPKQEEVDNILQHKPDFYVPIHNTPLKDFGALVMVLKKIIPLPEWDYLFWFTDDMLPMRRTFLRPFVEKISKPNVGLVAQCYEPRRGSAEMGGEVGGHIRTVAYATKRSVSELFELPWYRDLNPGCGHDFEYGPNHILKQIRNMGFDLELCHSKAESENYMHWTSFLDWMWDCSLLGRWEEYWGVYEEQFNPIQLLEDVEGKVETLLSIKECEKRTSNKGVSAVMPTSGSSVRQMMLSVMSVLLRSSPRVLNKIIVGIHGPESDKKTQDAKQSFLEELCVASKDRMDVSVTISRVWGEIEHSTCAEQISNLADTETYVLMRDDTMVLDNLWCDQIDGFMSNESSIIKIWGNPGIHVLENDDKSISVPCIDTSFVLCKKPTMQEIGAKWSGYTVNMEHSIGNLTSFNLFTNWHRKHNTIGSFKEGESKKYQSINLCMGSFVFDKIANNRLEMERFDGDTACKISLIDSGKNIEKLESEIKKFPEMEKIYVKYRDMEKSFYKPELHPRKKVTLA